MSYKNPSLPRPIGRLAPLATAAALLCAASASMAQVVVNQTNTGVPLGTTTAVINTNTGSSTFSPTSTNVNNNAFGAVGIGNTAPTASLDFDNQPLATPTVTVTQSVSAATSGTATATKIGIDATGSAGNTGSRTNAQGSVSGNSLQSSATGNTDAAALTIESGTPLTVSTPASATTSQAVVSTVTATTTVSGPVGMNLQPRNGNWDNLGLTVGNNEIGAAAISNQSRTGVAIDAGGALTLSSPVTSNVTQNQQGAVSASSQAGLLGIAIQHAALTPLPANGDFTVSGNGVEASAQGNQQTNSVQIDAATLTQTGGAPNNIQAASNQSGTAGVGALSQVATLGVNNLKPASTNNEYTVSGNAVSADASGNVGSTTVQAGSNDRRVSSITGVGAAASSAQSYNSPAGISAQASAGQIGVAVGGPVIIVGPLGVSTGDQQAATKNAVQASALGSQANNQATLYGATVGQSSAGASNIQAHVAGNVGATASATTLGVTIVTSSTNGHQTVNDNSVQASAQGALATNLAEVDASNSATGVAAGVSNSQLHLDGNVTAGASAGLLGRNVPISIGDQVTVNDNTVGASALGTKAGNITSIEGATVNGGTASILNGQTHTAGNVSATANVNTLGTTSSISSTNSRQAVSGNLVQADAQGTVAANQASISAGNSATGVTAGVTSVQIHTAGDVGALANVGALGRSALVSVGEDVAINDNAVEASAMGSKANNQAAIEGATVTNAVAAVANAQTHTAGGVNAIASVNTLGTASGAASTGNRLTINGNSVQTTAQGADSSNRASVRADGAMTNPIAAAANNQEHVAGDINALSIVGLVGSQTPLSTNDQLVVNGNKLTASAGSQNANNQATLDASSLNASALGAGAAVNNIQIHRSGNVQAYVGSTQAWSPDPFNPAPAMVGASNGALVGGTAVVSGNSSVADANINLASNGVAIQSEGSINGVSANGIANNQLVESGNASARVKVNYGVTGVRSLGNQAVVSGNSSQASASQNQAANELVLKAGNLLSSVTPVLASVQDSRGNTSAMVETSLLTGTGIVNLDNGDTTISNNTASTSARANVANNSVSIDSGTQTAGLGSLSALSNKQTNTGAAASSTDLQIPVGSVAALGGAITVTGNSASSLALGNAALNSIQANAGTALNGGSVLALANTQDNFGPINAVTTLNAPVVSGGGNVTITNNTASATAFGNSAVNQVNLTALPSQLVASASLTSNQTNTGAVTAVVNGNFTNSNSGGSSGSINISGNRATAVAVGNSSTSSMVIGVK